MAVSPNTNFSSGQILTAQQANNWPRGVMGYYISTGNSSISTTTADVTGTSITFTAEANRLYRATFICDFTLNTANSITGFYIADGSNTLLQSIADTVSTANGFSQVTLQLLFTASAGSVTRKVRCDTSAGSGSVRGTSGAVYMFSIEDMGPV
tara:strand:+ start:1579 stop:2037 length:459 start_codon:yes stop_codon:yes gene_type:complete